jgi:hypothetical protein
MYLHSRPIEIEKNQKSRIQSGFFCSKNGQKFAKYQHREYNNNALKNNRKTMSETQILNLETKLADKQINAEEAKKILDAA